MKKHCFIYIAKHFSQFFTGEWHEIQITPFNFGDVDKCGTITFNVTGNDVGYKYSQQG